MRYLIIFAAAYLLGSVCASIPISKNVYGGDVRNYGSGNAGATNMARVYGIKTGLLTLVCDMAKTFVSVLLGQYLAGDTGVALAGAGCIIGHCFPAFFGFKGGKGVSVGAALAIVNGWQVLVITMAIFFACAFISKKVSLGSMCAAAALALSALLIKPGTPLIATDAFACVLVIFMHRSNIKRLLNGTEADFKTGSTKK